MPNNHMATWISWGSFVLQPGGGQNMLMLYRGEATGPRESSSDIDMAVDHIRIASMR
jgi:fructose-1,6-bisphosphatase/sedoheptulose 1,7-bisphosphatase-like protein